MFSLTEWPSYEKGAVNVVGVVDFHVRMNFLKAVWYSFTGLSPCSRFGAVPARRTASHYLAREKETLRTEWCFKCRSSCLDRVLWEHRGSSGEFRLMWGVALRRQNVTCSLKNKQELPGEDWLKSFPDRQDSDSKRTGEVWGVSWEHQSLRGVGVCSCGKVVS